MKLTFIVLPVIVLASCVKVDSSKPEVPKVKAPQIEPLKLFVKKGLRCELNGLSERKDIFLHVREKDGKTSVSLHDYLEKDKISVVAVNFEGYRALTFDMQDIGKGKLEGTGVLMHSDLQSLSERGKVITATGRLTLNADQLSGKIDRKLVISHEDKQMEITPYEEIALIENCEKTEASWR